VQLLTSEKYQPPIVSELSRRIGQITSLLTGVPLFNSNSLVWVNPELWTAKFGFKN